MLAACYLSCSLGLLERATLDRVRGLLNRFGLPTAMLRPIPAERILEAVRHDKKVRSGRTRLVLLEGVGRPVVRGDIPDSLIRDAYETLL
jgi:3-dehydroquinate synthase